MLGTIIYFRPDHAAKAYESIAEIEPDKHYRWDQRDSQGIHFNTLIGRSPRKGSDAFEQAEWDGRNDPLFTAALDVVEETLRRDSKYERDLKPLFRLQMAYLLLWSSLERYASLRYHLGESVSAKVKCIAEEPAFSSALKQVVQESRDVFRADRPSKKLTLEKNDPKGSLDYYYQVRSNITHRGKSAMRDHGILKDSLAELLQIFKSVLRAAFDDAQVDKQTSSI